MTVRDLSQRLTEEEFGEWLAYDSISPIGGNRIDILAAQICSVIANVNRNQKKKPSPYTIKDFLLFQEKEEKKKQTPEEALSILKAVARTQKRKSKKRKAENGQQGRSDRKTNRPA